MIDERRYFLVYFLFDTNLYYIYLTYYKKIEQNKFICWSFYMTCKRCDFSNQSPKSIYFSKIKISFKNSKFANKNDKKYD